jgi:hypothetical protein
MAGPLARVVAVQVFSARYQGGAHSARCTVSECQYWNEYTVQLHVRFGAWAKFAIAQVAQKEIQIFLSALELKTSTLR